MQTVSDCPQFGGVISRAVVLSRRSAFVDSRTAVCQPSAVCRHLKAEPEKVHLVRLAYPAFLLVHLSRMRRPGDPRRNCRKVQNVEPMQFVQFVQFPQALFRTLLG
jgi:hypothetical protein